MTRKQFLEKVEISHCLNCGDNLPYHVYMRLQTVVSGYWVNISKSRTKDGSLEDLENAITGRLKWSNPLQGL